MGNQFYRALVEYSEIKAIPLPHGFTFLLETIGDTDKLIESMNEEDLKKEERFPYWAELWPSSVGLAEYILENKDYFKHKKVLELGCGLGLAGIAAQAAESDVVFSDIDPLALEFTRRNFKRNFARWPRALLLDWRRPCLQEHYDIILGADVLYERQLLIPLQTCCEQAVGDRGCIIIADPGRRMATEFLNLVIQAGWPYESELKYIELNNKNHAIHIYRINPCCT